MVKTEQFRRDEIELMKYEQSERFKIFSFRLISSVSFFAFLITIIAYYPQDTLFNSATKIIFVISIIALFNFALESITKNHYKDFNSIRIRYLELLRSNLK
jgi:hypothetical protein